MDNFVDNLSKILRRVSNTISGKSLGQFQDNFRDNSARFLIFPQPIRLKDFSVLLDFKQVSLGLNFIFYLGAGGLFLNSK